MCTCVYECMPQGISAQSMVVDMKTNWSKANPSNFMMFYTSFHKLVASRTILGNSWSVYCISTKIRKRKNC